jgi:hypothetical protein
MLDLRVFGLSEWRAWLLGRCSITVGIIDSWFKILTRTVTPAYIVVAPILVALGALSDGLRIYLGYGGNLRERVQIHAETNLIINRFQNLLAAFL